MARVCVFIDGFNMYHAMMSHTPSLSHYRWLDYMALAKCYIGGKDSLIKVTYFSALATWDQNKVNRHQVYLQALRRQGVEIILGKFKRKDRDCRLCGQTFQTFEEKLTDVNIAIHMFRGATLDEYDRAILISGDTDILPAIRAIHELFPSKQVGVVIPVGRQSEELKNECDLHYRMKEAQLARCQLPQCVVVSAGVKICCPTSWK